MANKTLNAAKTAKKDEFYTQLSDIERELQHYWPHFRGKTVLCNCDDPYESNFFKYFALRFNQLGLRRLICTCYNGSPVQGSELLLQFDNMDSEPKKIAYKVEITEVKDENGDGAVDLSDVRYLLQNDKNVLSTLKTGDFRSQECIELLKQADIVVTNPPFSLFREYIGQLVEYGKKFIIVGRQMNITYKEFFPLIKENKVWLGYGFKGAAAHFITPYKDVATASNHKEGMVRVSGVTWFTNLEITKRNEEIDLVCRFSPDEYPKYDNYNAINVDRTQNIPMDYAGIMGVPLTFLDKYNPQQFEIIWQASGNTRASAPSDVLKEIGYIVHPEDRGGCAVVKWEKAVYKNIYQKQTSEIIMMTIKQIQVTVGEITKGYINNDELGVRGYGGQLDIRPAYQREFIYNEKEQQAVITTVLNGYPLNVMYWVKRGDDAECPYEVMDGQQRTLSLCEYVAGKFSYDFKNFFNQPADIQRRILDYRLTVYVCEGEPSEKLAWFKTINIAGKELNEQEINNAIYAGPFVSDAKLHFSKSNCGAYRLGKDLVNGTPIRQDFLKKALEWMAAHETRCGHGMTAVEYMAKHQHDPNANNMWTYFQNVLNWATTNFNLKKFKKIMKGLDWALLYDNYHEQTLDTAILEKRISQLLADTDYEIQRPQGIIPYVLTGDEHFLNLRAFPETIKLAVWEEQKHMCPLCHKAFDYELMEGDHIIPWSKGGRTVKENCQMLCMECNRRKGGK